MHWHLLRRALVLGTAVAAVGFAAPTAAQSSGPSAASARPTASATSSQDVPDTVRRRPMRRTAARLDSVFTVSSAARAASSSASAGAAHAAMVAMSVREGSRPWLGTPYRWGGTTRRGVDCSAFVRAVMLDQFGLDLPRATAGQQFEGIAVSRAELLPGDLVFFRRTGVRHVGIYLGEGEFVHASSSRGVIVSTMDSGYWNNQYWMARRVLDGPTSGRRPTPRADVRRLPDSDSVRVRG